MKINSLIKRLQDIASRSGDVEVYIQSSSNTSNIKCNCHEKHGDEIGTGGWVCPVHGRQFGG